MWACSYFLHDRKLLTIAHHPTVFSALVTYLPTTVCWGHRQTDSFNSVKHAALGKTLCGPVSDNSAHIGNWTKAGMWIRSWIFLKDGNPASRNRLHRRMGELLILVLSSMCWERWKGQVLTVLRPKAWIRIPLTAHLVLFRTVVAKITQLWDSM